MSQLDSPVDFDPENFPKKKIRLGSDNEVDIAGSSDDLEKQLRLYSISKAAEILHINEESLNELIAMGQIGYLLIGKRKKIPFKVLAKYEENFLIIETKDKSSEELSPVEINRLLQGKQAGQNKTLNPREMLKTIMRTK